MNTLSDITNRIAAMLWRQVASQGIAWAVIAIVLACSGCASGKVLGIVPNPFDGGSGENVAPAAPGGSMAWLGFVLVVAGIGCAIAGTAMKWGDVRALGITLIVAGIGAVVTLWLAAELFVLLRIPIIIAAWCSLIFGAAWFGARLFVRWRLLVMERKLPDDHKYEKAALRRAANGGLTA